MMLLSALHALLVGALILGVAAPTAGLLRARNRDERWVWAGALVGAVALPPLLRLLPEPSSLVRTATGGALGPESAGWVAEVSGLSTGPTTAMASWLSPTLVALWGLASGILALVLATRVALPWNPLVWILGRKLRSTPVEEADVPLRRTEVSGPAVVGFFQPAVLIPGWVFRLPRTHRDWIVRHEVEHLRGRDPLLLALVLATRVALPWNPLVWILGRKLRIAIEIDCDRRTLGPDTAGIESYVEALLRVTRGPSQPLPAAAFAFAESSLSLEERIRSMTRKRRPLSTALRLGLAGLAVLVLAVACELPTPSTADEEDDSPPQAAVAELERARVREQRDARSQSEADEASSPAASLEQETFVARELGDADTPAETSSSTETPAQATFEAQEEPAFTPFTERPEIRNREEVSRTLRDVYSDQLREAGIGGQVIVWFYINAEGRVEQTRVAQESGHPELDRAALQVANVFEFEPARNQGDPVAVWVRLPITFRQQ